MRNDYLNQKSLRVAVYCRVATDTQVTDQAKDIVGERRETMTGQQLEQIAALRLENYPYSFIGRELGLSPNTVKSVCRRKGFGATGSRKTKAEKLNAPICRYCHKIINGRKGQNFCSEFCRIEWWKARRKVIAK